MTMQGIVFTDRYGPAGPPSQLAGCRGDCEAMGVIPVHVTEHDQREPASAVIRGSEEDPRLLALWHEAHAVSDHTYEGGICDGTHFVPCPDCNGQGVLPWHQRWRNVPHVIERQWSFTRSHLLVMPYGARTVRLASQATAFELDENGQPLWRDPPRIERASRRLGADRHDVPFPWLHGRLVALKVLTSTTRHQRAERRYRLARRLLRGGTTT